MKSATPKTQAPTVFLCHSSDDKPIARALWRELSQLGAKVWIDEAEIGVGDSLQETIQNAIDLSDFFIVLLTNRSINSSWVTRELETALVKDIDVGERRVLPVRAENVKVPGFLRGTKYSDLSRGFDTVVSELADRMQLVDRFSSYWLEGDYGRHEFIIQIPGWYPLRTHEAATVAFPQLVEEFRAYIDEQTVYATVPYYKKRAMHRLNDFVLGDTQKSLPSSYIADVSRLHKSLAEWFILYMKQLRFIANPGELTEMGEAIKVLDKERVRTADLRCEFSTLHNEYAIVEV